MPDITENETSVTGQMMYDMFKSFDDKINIIDDYKELDYLVVIDELGLRNPLDSNAYEILIAGEKTPLTQFRANVQTVVWIYKILKGD